MYSLGLILVALFSFNNAFSEKSGIFDEHKIRSYSPLKGRIKDVLFDVRVEGMLEKIKKSTTITNIDDVYFRVYWYFPDRYRVDIEGLPKGFKVLRSNLRQSVKPYVDLLFAQDLVTQFARFRYTRDSKDKQSFNKIKKNGDLTDVSITFNRNGLMDTITSKSTFTGVKTMFDYSKKSWSDGKFVTDAIKISEKANSITNVKDISIEYTLKNNVGLPEVVNVTEKFMSGVKVINSSKKKIKFSNYVINTGKARNILQGKKY